MHHAAAGVDPWTVWAFEPLVLLVLGAVAVLYAHGWWRLRSRGRRDLATIWRAFSFYAGLNILVLALVVAAAPPGPTTTCCRRTWRST